MKDFTDIFDRIDAYFEGKSEGERWILILLPAALIAYVVWMTVTPQAEASYKKSISDKKHAKKQLMTHKQYLQSITVNGDRDYHIKVYNKKIAMAKKRAANYRKKIALLDKNLNKLSDMLFNKKSWSLFLDSITARAHDRNVQLETITNKYVDSNGSFGHVLEVGVTCQGAYPDIIRFINDLEQNTLVTDVYSSSIYTRKNESDVFADINISVWGVNH